MWSRRASRWLRLPEGIKHVRSASTPTTRPGRLLERRRRAALDATIRNIRTRCSSPSPNGCIAVADAEARRDGDRRRLRLRRDDDRLRRPGRARWRGPGPRHFRTDAGARPRARPGGACRPVSFSPTPRSTNGARREPISSCRGSASCSSPIRAHPSPTCAGASSRRAARLRLLARGQAKPVDRSLPLQRSGQACPSPARNGPGGPRPLRLRRSRARVRRILSEAGFADIVLTPEDLELDIAVGQGLDAAVDGGADDRSDEPDA